MKRLGLPLTQLVLLLSTVYFLLPLAWVLVNATKGSDDLFSAIGFAFGERFALFDNLAELGTYQHGLFWRWMLNTVFYAGAGATVATLLAALAGYTMAKYRFRGSGTLSVLILGAVLVPTTALALPLYFLMVDLGLDNNPLAVILPSCVSPIGVYLARIYAGSSVPNEVMDAARVDGVGEYSIFFSISARLMAPALVTIFLFQFVAIWNNFFLPLVMLNERALYPITLGLVDWNSTPPSSGNVIYHLVVTGALVSVIPLVAAFLLLQRHWRSGLAAGSITA
ncbi:carbohydrate ABC transporter permease [Planomonospora venezuelensis]|uniref:Multiple sugar transport system permease protein n=1 Tax=Planomonospora venezuelensis TaxID=1999 RepID=A0A841D572_PLAVE|nr:multiple sugar transport system permease protein [Planomonospora venezuelensis]GIN02096.1 sugar ABC transporter permease [Planomonospora venezuelensis]